MKLIPILVFFVVVSLVFVDEELVNDENRYAGYARNLTHGFYAPHDTLNLWSGPGYPLVLVPFVATDVSLVWAKHLNSILLWLGVCFVYLTLREYVSAKKALWGAYVMALYVPFLPYMVLLLTESLAVCLCTGFCYYLVKRARGSGGRHTWLAGAFCAGLILTKVIFAYVVIVGLLLSLLLSVWRSEWRRVAFIYGVAFLFCLPYLFYTYRLTGKVFYWANSGGDLLYWMTSSRDGEYGDWRGLTRARNDERLSAHAELSERLSNMDYVQRDAALKKEAIVNLTEHPGAYCFKWVMNVGRMWYDYPYSHKLQRPHTLFVMVPSSLLLAGILSCVPALWRGRKCVPGELKALMLFALVFLGGASLISSGVRFVVPIVPIVVMTVVLTRSGCWGMPRG